MRIYPLHDLNEQDFENLSILICSKILGAATIPFAKGKDGGKDGRFTGRANCFPSEAQPWEGNIIIQAKHTIKPNASCSDSDFQKILQDEIPKIQKLKENKELDYYLLFTNRKLTGGQDSKIIDLFGKQNVTYVIIANERIQDFLKEYPDIIRTAKLNDLLKPLEFDESDLKEFIIEIHKAIKQNAHTTNSVDFTKIDMEEKNKLNNLSKSYFDEVVRKDVNNFNQVETFLSSPINASLKDLYADTISELNAKISLRRDEFVEFGNMLDEFYNFVISNDTGNLKGKKRLVRTLLNYMYCNCDIGRKEK
ncbi:MAG: hypothetical protein LBC64_11345 [Fibromonadaceae bacterium]|jgi:hypothetical protein|nr:hypothetical protein [Fibromonadaceae bacterium]